MTQEQLEGGSPRLRTKSRMADAERRLSFVEAGLSFTLVVETADNLAAVIETLSVIKGMRLRCNNVRYEAQLRGGFLVLEVGAEDANLLTPAIDRIRGLANVRGCSVVGMGRPNSD